jgi:hypothetical protein
MRAVAATLLLLAFPIVAPAHHSVAGFFDPNRQIEIEGIVTATSWVKLLAGLSNPEVSEFFRREGWIERSSAWEIMSSFWGMHLCVDVQRCSRAIFCWMARKFY